MSRTDLILPKLAKKRLDQVELEGRSRAVLKRLQRKAEQHAKLRSWLKDHVTGRTHVVDVDSYLRNALYVDRMGPPMKIISKRIALYDDQKGPFRKIISEMDQEASSELARIEQTIRESLQIVSAHTSPHLLSIQLTGG